MWKIEVGMSKAERKKSKIPFSNVRKMK